MSIFYEIEFAKYILPYRSCGLTFQISLPSYHRRWGRPDHSVKPRESICTSIPPFAGGETGPSLLHSEVPGNSCSSNDASSGTRNSGEGNEEMGTTARPAGL